MLFDLRSRGRRRTVQAVYLGLAILMGGGLVLFGVGAGNGVGGLLNAFTAAAQQPDAGRQPATRRPRSSRSSQDPNDAAAWASLVQARWTTPVRAATTTPPPASSPPSGKKELKNATQAWQKYLKLTKKPDPNVAILAARAYAAARRLRQPGGAVGARGRGQPERRPRASNALPPPPTPPSRPARATSPPPRRSARPQGPAAHRQDRRSSRRRPTHRSPSPAEPSRRDVPAPTSAGNIAAKGR